MSKITWADIIERVLENHKEGLTTKEIAEIIIKNDSRPPNTKDTNIPKRVSGAISQNRTKNDKPIFDTLDDNKYFLSKYRTYNAFGMKWDFEKTNKKSLIGYTYKRYGCQNIYKQIGVYFLYDDNDNVIYVGQTMRPFIKRLKEHTADHLAGLWRKFSWFGWYPVYETGDMKDIDKKTISNEEMITYMEAVIIKVFKPILAGNDNDVGFNEIEFFQK